MRRALPAILAALVMTACSVPPPPPLPAHVRAAGSDFVTDPGYESLGWVLCLGWPDGQQPYTVTQLPDGELIQCQNGDNDFRYGDARRYGP